MRRGLRRSLWVSTAASCRSQYPYYTIVSAVCIGERLSGRLGMRPQLVTNTYASVATLHDRNSVLLGTGLQSRAKVLQYLSWGKCTVAKHAASISSVLLRRVPFNSTSLDFSNAEIDACAKELEQRLATHTYLVGERVTLADLYVASCFFSCLGLTLGTQWRETHPVFMRWFDTVARTEYLVHALEQLTFVDRPCKTPKFASRRRKPLHPLEYLGKPAISLKVWKRVAGDFRRGQFHSVAMPYFWNTFFNPRDWSIWGVDYYCPDGVADDVFEEDLNQYMQRLHFSNKFLYGVMCLYRKNGKLRYFGAFLVRGTNAAPAFNCVSSWKDINYTRLDPSRPEVRRQVACVWSFCQCMFGNQQKACAYHL